MLIASQEVAAEISRHWSCSDSSQADVRSFYFYIVTLLSTAPPQKVVELEINPKLKLSKLFLVQLVTGDFYSSHRDPAHPEINGKAKTKLQRVVRAIAQHRSSVVDH